MQLVDFFRSRRGGELVGIVVMAIGISLAAALLTYHPARFLRLLHLHRHRDPQRHRLLRRDAGLDLRRLLRLRQPALSGGDAGRRLEPFLGPRHRVLPHEADRLRHPRAGRAAAVRSRARQDLAARRADRLRRLPRAGDQSRRQRQHEHERRGDRARHGAAHRPAAGDAHQPGRSSSWPSISSSLALGRAMSLQWARFSERRRKEKMKDALVRKHLEKAEAPQLRLVPCDVESAPSSEPACAARSCAKCKGAAASRSAKSRKPICAKPRKRCRSRTRTIRSSCIPRRPRHAAARDPEPKTVVAVEAHAETAPPVHRARGRLRRSALRRPADAARAPKPQIPRPAMRKPKEAGAARDQAHARLPAAGEPAHRGAEAGHDQRRGPQEVPRDRAPDRGALRASSPSKAKSPPIIPARSSRRSSSSRPPA